MSATLHRTEGEREAFEAWFLKGGTAPSALERDDLGYVVSVTAACWEAWQDRAALSGWQPIETAPKANRDMFVVQAFDVTDLNCGVRRYTSDPYCVWPGDTGGWVRWPHPFPPTHWTPLPPAPNQGEPS